MGCLHQVPLLRDKLIIFVCDSKVLQLVGKETCKSFLSVSSIFDSGKRLSYVTSGKQIMFSR